jgi:hypothetical protein
MGCESPKLNVLVAFPYLKAKATKLLSEECRDVRLLLDSGAFTAWNTGKPVKLDDYCRFIEKLPFKPWRYFSLDVIGDPDRSFINYEKMVKRGFNPVPVFTRGDDLDMVDEYYKTSDVLGIGGLVGTVRNKNFVKGVMERIGKRKVHWLGFTRHDFVNYYRPYMCDTSAWVATRYHDLRIYTGKGVIENYKKKDFVTKPKPDILKVMASYGVSSSDLRRQSFWSNGNKLNTVAARMWVRRSIETEKMLGTHLFLAFVGAHDLRMLLNGFRNEVLRWK